MFPHFCGPPDDALSNAGGSAALRGMRRLAHRVERGSGQALQAHRLLLGALRNALGRSQQPDHIPGTVSYESRYRTPMGTPGLMQQAPNSHLNLPLLP